MAIQNFRHRGLKKFFYDGDRQGIPQKHAGLIATILTRLDDATKPEQMNFPGYRLHPLKGNLKDFWAVRISKNWRIIFRFEDETVRDVNLIDYH